MDHVHDPARLLAVEATGLLDGPEEETFDRLTRLAARIVGTPRSAMTLVTADRQFFVSAVGFDAAAAPLEHSYCAHAIATDTELAAADAREHPLLAGSPAIAGGAIAYAGVPLRSGDGHALGTLCVLDERPRDWTVDELAALRDLAAAATTELGLREANRTLSARIAVLQAAAESSPDTLAPLVRAGTTRVPATCGSVLHDTGSELPNGVLLRDRLGQAVARQRRRPVTTGVLVVMLPAGTSGAGAATVGAVLGRVLRPGDTVSHTGEHELTLVCEDVGDAETLQALAARIVTDLGVAGVGGALSLGPDEDPELLLSRAARAASEAAGCVVRHVVVAGAATIPAGVLRPA